MKKKKKKSTKETAPTAKKEPYDLDDAIDNKLIDEADLLRRSREIVYLVQEETAKGDTRAAIAGVQEAMLDLVHGRLCALLDLWEPAEEEKVPDDRTRKKK